LSTGYDWSFKYYRGRKGELVGELRRLLSGEVRLAIIFGSFVEQEHYRDIDLAVYSAEKSLDYYLLLAARLEEALGTPVDVVPIEELEPRLRLKILTRGIIVVEEPGIYEYLLLNSIDELNRLAIAYGYSLY